MSEQRYFFDTHYGKCTLIDSDTGVGITWEKGKFNETNEGFIDPTSMYNLAEDAGKTAQEVARICRELGDYVVQNYPEMI